MAPFNGLFHVPVIILHSVRQGSSIPVLRMKRGVVVNLPSLSIPPHIRGPTTISYWSYTLRHVTEHPSEANIGESFIPFFGQNRSHNDFEIETFL